MLSRLRCRYEFPSTLCSPVEALLKARRALAAHNLSGENLVLPSGVIAAARTGRDTEHQGGTKQGSYNKGPQVMFQHTCIHGSVNYSS